MGIDVGGAFTIAGTSGSQALNIAGTANVFNIDTVGRTTYPDQIGFIVGMNSDVGWVAQAAGWSGPQAYFNYVYYNKGGGYSGGRFTAPVTGSYLLHWVASEYKPTAVAGHYTHPKFYINGGDPLSAYRLKGYFAPTGGYWISHNEIVDIYYLNAGDYVDFRIYHAAAGISLYQYYSMISGFLVG